MRDYDEYIPIDRRGRCALDTVRKIIYLNTPKAASTSCKTVMEALGARLCNHFEERVNLDDYFKLAIIRDPVARFISTFVYLSAGSRAMEYGTCEKDFYNHRDYDARKMELFISEIERDYWDPHTQPQCWWLTDEDFRLIKFDHIFIADANLAQAFVSTFRAKLSLEVSFPYMNEQDSGIKKRAVELLRANPDLLGRVRELYACDFELYREVKGR